MAKVLAVKIKEKESHRPGCIEYKNDVNFLDFKSLALFFIDLETHGANVEKAFREFKKQKTDLWPFE